MNVDVRGRAAFLAYRAGAELARVVPPGLGGRAADGLARVARVAAVERREQVARTLTRVTAGQLRGAALERAVDTVFANYARYWHELFRLGDRTGDQLRAELPLEGTAVIDGALARGRGAVLALPHLGNWDYAGAGMVAHGYRMSAVAEVVEPPELFAWFVRTRERLGLRVIPLGADSASVVARHLAAGRVVCLLADRDITGTGVEVEFFGERTTVPGGPALLALRTGAPLVAGAAYFTEARRGPGRAGGGPGHVGRFLREIPAERQGRLRDDVARVTQDLVHAMEDAIRAAPEQWLLMQPNWPGDRR